MNIIVIRWATIADGPPLLRICHHYFPFTKYIFIVTKYVVIIIHTTKFNEKSLGMSKGLIHLAITQKSYKIS